MSSLLLMSTTALQTLTLRHQRIHMLAHPLDAALKVDLRRGTLHIAATALRDASACEVRIVNEEAKRMLWVASSLPPGLPLPILSETLTDLSIAFPPTKSPVRNATLREQRRPAYITLALRERDVQALLFAYYSRTKQSADTGEQALADIGVGNLEAHLRKHLEQRQRVQLPDSD